MGGEVGEEVTGETGDSRGGEGEEEGDRGTVAGEVGTIVAMVTSRVWEDMGSHHEGEGEDMVTEMRGEGEEVRHRGVGPDLSQRNLSWVHSLISGRPNYRVSSGQQK